MSAKSKYLTPDEVAAELRFKTARPVHKAIRRGELKALEISGHFRIAREDLEAYLQGPAQAAVTEAPRPPRPPAPTAPSPRIRGSAPWARLEDDVPPFYASDAELRALLKG
jgi:excisionase family DNA binding protein